jgi:hypothetical protein
LAQGDNPGVILEDLCSKELTRFALVTRCSGFSGPISRRQYRRALRIAAAVVQWAERQVRKP